MLDHISHSQINMWLRCPSQWAYRYVHGIKSPPSGALILGGAYHTALEKNFRQKINSGEDLPLPDCLDLFSDAWNVRLKEEEDIVWDKLSPGQHKDQGVGLVSAYRVNTSPSVTPVTVEKTYISEVAGTKFICIVDLIDSEGLVIDHKTSARKYAQVDVDKDLQASAEAFVLGRAIHYSNHIALKTARPTIQITNTYRLDTDIDWWYILAAKIVSLMKSGIAPPNPTGWWCSEKFCGYWDKCRKDLARSYI